jgi:hypothetical protein
VISIVVLASRAGEDPHGRPLDPVVWRGPRAPAALPAGARSGAVEEHSLGGRAIGARAA